VKRFLTVLLCLFFFLSGPAWVWADCFKHTHGATDEAHHHGVISAVIHHGHSEDDGSAPRFHCPQFWFDLNAVVSSLVTSKPKPLDYKDRLASYSDLSLQQFSLSLQSRSIESVEKFLSYPFLIGVSPHLLLSVFRI
jgi:hypothetical protein